MSKKPYMPLWTGDYLKKTRHLTTVEHGAYLLLIMECWERPSGSLPNNHDLLARLAGLSREEWDKISPMVLEFFKLDGRKNEWFQDRVTEEREKASEKREKAQHSAARRWKKTKKQDASAMQADMLGECERNANHTHTHKKENDKSFSKDFDLFWEVYGKKVDKKQAEDQWKRKVKDGTLADHIIAAASQYAKARDPKYRKSPMRWLRDENWNDEIEAGRSKLAERQGDFLDQPTSGKGWE